MINLNSKISYPFHFLIERNNSSEELTIFNLLPKNWIGSEFALKIAALLPCSPIEFSYGWVSSKHNYSQMPEIKYYYQFDINTIKKIDRLKNINKIFFASEDFSIDLINSITIRDVPSIVLTSTHNYIDKLNNCHIILIDNKSENEIIKELYHYILEILNKYKTYDGKDIIIDDFLETYLLKKEFLPQIEITPNLICNANETVFTNARGKIPNYLSFDESKILGLKECYKENQKLTYEIINEKFLDLYLNIKSSNSEFPRELPKYFDEKIDFFIRTELSNYNKKRVYKSLKNDVGILKNFDMNEELVLLIPSVNDFCRELIFKKLFLEFDGKYRREIKDLINALLSGGKEIQFQLPEKEEKFVKLFNDLGNTRLAENKFLTAMIGLYASSRLSPVLKTASVSSHLFTKIRILREKTTRLSLSREQKNESDYKIISEYFEEFQKKMGDIFPLIYQEMIESFNINKYTIFSDLPFELMINKNEVFCHKYHVTRIPITPLRFLLNHYNQYAIVPAFSVKISSMNEILFINSIPENDPLFMEFIAFKETCKQVGLNLNFISVNESKEFISYINDNNPPILIYYGHAAYDVEKDKGYLIFKNDTLSFETLNELTNIPSIVCLVGCETASSAAFSGGLSTYFLEYGARSVLATLFPIPADHAGSFIGRLLATINQESPFGAN